MALTREERTEIENVLIEHVEEPATARALQVLRDNEYGHCPDCGADIPVERLRAEPTSLRCVRCQTLFEKNFAGQRRGQTL